jgi:uroporphyrinogen-III synthase
MRPTLVLTLPRLRARPWQDALDREGLAWVHWPLSEIKPALGLSALDLRARIAASTWTLLPSPSAVIVLMQTLCQAGLAWPAGTGLGLIGPGSLRALEDWFDHVPGLRLAPLLMPVQAPFDAAALVAHPALSEPGLVRGLRVLVLHRPDGQDRWLRALVARGARLEVLALYRQQTLGLDDRAQHCLRLAAEQLGADADACVGAGAPGLLLSVASRGAGTALMQAAESMGLRTWLSGQILLTHHPAIAQAMRATGFRRIELHAPGVEACIERMRTLESGQLSSS